MESLDMLRDEIKILADNHIDTDELVRITNAIESEVEENYVLLPKDANGETIHLWDMIERCGRVFKVAGLSETQVFCFDDDGEILNYGVKVIHHHKPPTVEDVLLEIVHKCQPTYSKDGSYTTGLTEEEFAEYAKRLQLRES